MLLRLFALMIPTLLLCIPACGDDRDVGVQRIQIWWGLGGLLGEQFEHQVDQFNSAQKQIVVEVHQQRGYAGVQQELNKAFENGNLPDAAVIEIHSVATFAADKRILPLDQFIKDDPDFQPKDLLPGILSNLRYQEQLYAVPLNRSTPILYFNQTRFADVGLDPTNPPQTWEQLRTVSQKLTSPDGERYGLVTENFPWLFESLVWGAGGELMDGTTPTFATAGAKPLQLWSDLIHLDRTARFHPRGAGRPEFTSGRAAMFIESTALLEVISKSSDFQVGTAMVPPMAGFKNAVPTGGGAAVIPVGIPPARQKATWQFLAWFISTNQTAEWSRTTGYLPVRESGRALLKKDGFYDKFPAFETAVIQMKYAREAPNLKGWGGPCWNAIGEAMTTILRDGAPALETLRGAEENVQTLLKADAP